MPPTKTNCLLLSLLLRQAVRYKSYFLYSFRLHSCISLPVLFSVSKCLYITFQLSTSFRHILNNIDLIKKRAPTLPLNPSVLIPGYILLKKNSHYFIPSLNVWLLSLTTKTAVFWNFFRWVAMSATSLFIFSPFVPHPIYTSHSTPRFQIVGYLVLGENIQKERIISVFVFV